MVLSPFRGDGLQFPDQSDHDDWLLDVEESRGCELVHLNGYQHATLPFRSPRLVLGAF